MKSEPINKVNETEHYQKIIIFGENGVGKSSFISCLENYEKDDYEIKTKTDNNISNDSLNENPNSLLVEQIKKINIAINEDRKVYYYIYEVNIEGFDFIKENLDTLLVQVECIIFMYNNKETFDNIPKFIETIDSLNIQNRNIPMILVYNKFPNNDENNLEEEKNNEKEIDQIIQEISKEKLDLIHKKISLIEKYDYQNVFLEIDRKFNPENKHKNYNDVNNKVKFKYPFKKYKNKTLDNYNDIKTLEIILLGEPNTGKTTFLNYLDDKMIEDMKPNSEINDYQIFANICDMDCRIKIIDTIGEKSKKTLTNEIIQKTDGFLLFIDLTNEDSFKVIDNYIRKIKSINGSNEIILLGNKIDDNEKRVVKKKDVIEYGEKNQIKYYECSCKFGINIYEILNEICLMSFNKNENIDKVIYDKNTNINHYFQNSEHSCCNLNCLMM
jgi:small GTP-binding protein